MKGGTQPQLGFTIVEVLIVLAVTAVIFFSAVLLLNGRISKTEFQQAAYEAQTRIQQSINEVVNGFYPNSGNITCTATAAGPNISSAGQARGTNQGCLLIGKAIQFAVGAANSSQFNVYTIAALRQDSSGNEAITLAQAKPILIAQGGANPQSGFPNNEFENLQFENGITVLANSMYYNGNPANTIGTLAAMGSLGSNASGGGLNSSSEQVSLYAIPNTGLGNAQLSETDIIDNNLTAAIAVNNIQMCLVSGTTKQSALLTIGGIGTSDQLSVNSAIKDSVNCT